MRFTRGWRPGVDDRGVDALSWGIRGIRVVWGQTYDRVLAIVAPAARAADRTVREWVESRSAAARKGLDDGRRAGGPKPLSELERDAHVQLGAECADFGWPFRRRHGIGAKHVLCFPQVQRCNRRRPSSVPLFPEYLLLPISLTHPCPRLCSRASTRTTRLRCHQTADAARLVAWAGQHYGGVDQHRGSTRFESRDRRARASAVTPPSGLGVPSPRGLLRRHAPLPRSLRHPSRFCSTPSETRTRSGVCSRGPSSRSLSRRCSNSRTLARREARTYELPNSDHHHRCTQGSRSPQTAKTARCIGWDQIPNSFARHF